MPTIPQTQQFVSSDVSFANPSTRGAGAIGAATAGLGETLTNIGADLLKDVKETEARDQASTAYYEDKTFAHDTMAKLQKDYPDGYYKDENGERVKNKNNTGDKTISDVYHETVSKRYKERQMKFSTQLGQSLYVQKAGPLFSDTHLSLRNNEQILHTEAYKNNLGRLIEKMSSDAFLVPDTKFNYTNLDDLAGRISAESGKLLTPDEAKKLQARALSEVTFKRFEGKLNEIKNNLSYSNDPYARNQELTRLKLEVEGLDSVSQDRNKKKLNSFSDMLSADDKVKLSNQILALTKDTKQSQKSNYNIFRREMMGRVSRGAPVTSKDIATITSYVNSDALTPEEAQVDISNLTAASQVSQITSSAEFKNATSEERLRMAAQARSAALASRGKVPQGGIPEAGVESAHKAYDLIAEAASRDRDLERKNAANFQGTIKGSPQQEIDTTVKWIDPNSLKSNVAKIRQAAEQTESGYIKRYKDPRGLRIINSDVEKQYVEYFKGGGPNPASNQQKATLLSTIKEVYGEKYFKNVMNQLIGEGGLEEKWRIAGYITDDLTKVDFMDALTNNSAIVKQNYETNGGDSNKVNAAVDFEFKAFANSISKSNAGSPRNQALLNGIIDFARTKVMLMQSQPGAGSVKDSAKKVFDDVITKQTHGVDFRTNEGVSYREYIPKKYYNREITENEAKNVRRNFDVFKNPKNIQKLDLVVLDAAGKQSKYDEQFAKQVSETVYTTIRQGKVYFYYKPRNSTTEVFVYKKDPSAEGGISPYSVDLEEWLVSPSDKAPYDPKQLLKRGDAVVE